jgi:3-phenylpropionate/trans-cinnamate dioxygenase ferredoxin reductase subunit
MTSAAAAAGTVIVGGGHAGFEAAAALRAKGYKAPVRVLCAEARAPYQRPPLSKGLLLGKAEAYNLPFRSPGFYAAQGIELLVGEAAASVDRAAGVVETEGGRRLPYDALVLATGARPRPLPVEGAGLDGVVYLRTLDEALALAARLAAAERVVVVGGGFIGLEAAAAARTLGKAVTVLEAAGRLMERVVAPVLSGHYLRLHERHGVAVVLGARLDRIEGDREGRARAVVLAGGERLAADLVVVGIGVAPEVALAQGAGIACGDGVLVDERARTGSDPAVYAAGDCANHPNRHAGEGSPRLRIESVQNATDQARAAAAAILGRDEPYDAVPWFWTDQYDAKLQMAGLSRGHDAGVLRGDPDSGRFSVFYYRGGRLAAVDSVNRPGDHLAARRLLAAGAPLGPAEAADEGFDLKAALGRAAA